MKDLSLLDQSAQDDAYLQARMKEMAVTNGPSIRVYDNENFGKPPLLFVPMLKELNLVYLPLAKHFQDTHRTVIFEPNLSTTSHCSIFDRANEITRVLDALKIPKAHVVAWSDTCSPAYIFGKDYPERCLSIAFLGISDRYKLPQPYRYLTHALSKYPLEKIFPASASAFLLAKCLGGSHVSPRWLYQHARLIPSFGKLLKFSIIPNLLEHSPVKGEMKVASKILCGDRDFLASPEDSRKMLALLPNAYGVDIIEDAEHFFVYVNHRDIAESLERFFGQLGLQ